MLKVINVIGIIIFAWMFVSWMDAAALNGVESWNLFGLFF